MPMDDVKYGRINSQSKGSSLKTAEFLLDVQFTISPDPFTD